MIMSLCIYILMCIKWICLGNLLVFSSLLILFIKFKTQFIFAVLCCQWGAVLSNVSAFCRHGPWCAIQHCFLCSFNLHDCSRLWYAYLSSLHPSQNVHLLFKTELTWMTWHNFVLDFLYHFRMMDIILFMCRSCSWWLCPCSWGRTCLSNSC